MDNFQSGANCPVRFQVTGQGGVSTLNVTSHNLDEMMTLADVSNTSHGGRSARLATKGDHKGTVNADFDADYPPYLNPPFIRAGVSGIMLFFYSALSLGRPIQVPVIIGRVHYEMAGVGSQTKWSFDVEENILAGLFVMPSA